MLIMAGVLWTVTAHHDVYAFVSYISWRVLKSSGADVLVAFVSFDAIL